VRLLDDEDISRFARGEEFEQGLDRSAAGLALSVFFVGVADNDDVAIWMDRGWLVHKCLFSIAFRLKDAVT